VVSLGSSSLEPLSQAVVLGTEGKQFSSLVDPEDFLTWHVYTPQSSANFKDYEWCLGWGPTFEMYLPAAHVGLLGFDVPDKGKLMCAFPKTPPNVEVSDDDDDGGEVQEDDNCEEVEEDFNDDGEQVEYDIDEDTEKFEGACDSEGRG